MCYQEEKIAYIAREDLGGQPKTGTLKKITALLNQIKQVRESSLLKILEDLSSVDLSNFLDDAITSLLEHDGRNVHTTMRIVFKLSRTYDDFDDVFLHSFKEILRQNLKTECIDFYAIIYAEICACGIEKQERYRNFLRKTMEGNFYKHKLGVLHSIIAFLMEQICELEQMHNDHRNIIQALSTYYRDNLEFLKELYIKLDKSSGDQKYIKLLNNALGIEIQSDNFVQIIELTEKEKKFYKNHKVPNHSTNEKSCRMTTDKIVQNIRNPYFVVSNLTRNQRKEEFIMSLLNESVELKYLAKIAAILNLDYNVEIIDMIHSHSNVATKTLSELVIQAVRSERKVYFACELFKFDCFDRDKLISMFHCLLKTKKYEMLINCLERAGRFLLAREYSSGGNEDIIKLLMYLNTRSSDVGVNERRAIRNCLERIVKTTDELDSSDVRNFMEFLVGKCKLIEDGEPVLKFDISDKLAVLFETNKLFLFTYLLDLWSFPVPIKLAKIFIFFGFNIDLVQSCISICMERDEKHKAISYAKLYGCMLSVSMARDLGLSAKIDSFVKKIFFSSNGNDVCKIYLVCEFLSPFPASIKTSCANLMRDFVEMNDEKDLKVHFVNFCRVNNIETDDV